LGIRTLLTLILTSLLYADTTLDPTLLSKSNYIDVVSVKGAADYVVYLQKLPVQERYLSTPLKRVTFKPQWKFYPHKASGQIVAVAELAGDDTWFDAAIYNTLSLVGSCHECKIALADKILFTKQDNYVIGDFKGEIDLNTIGDKVDLRHLKYLVLLVKDKDDLQLPSFSFEYQQRSDSKELATRSVWVWSSEDLDYRLLHRTGIQRVYLQLGPEFERDAKALFHEGFEVYGLDGDPHDVFDDQRLKKGLARIAKLNTHEKIVMGFQIDVEPHVLADFNIHKIDYINRLVRLVSTLTEEAHRQQLQFSLVTPFWYDTLIYQQRPLAYTLIDRVDEMVLMSYRSDPKRVLRISADELTYASYRHKTIRIGIELMPIADERHELFALTKSGPCIVKERLEPRCLNLEAQQEYVIKGSTLSFYDQSKALRELLTTPITYPAFQGFVFHHMRGLYLVFQADGS